MKNNSETYKYIKIINYKVNVVLKNDLAAYVNVKK